MTTFCKTGRALLLILSLGGQVSAADKEARPSEKVEKLLGEKTLAILKGADRVEVYRLNGDEDAKGDKKFRRFVITAIGKEQGKVFAGKLAAVLTTDEAYFGEGAKCFEPGVGYRIWNGKESIEVAICFGCFNLSIGDIGGEFGNFGKSKTNKTFGTVFIQLAKLAKEAFPDDKEIQELRDKD
ncbi:MAG: hypothetical protein K8T89_04700 [Planctomycetes bacterium]|nr:hypothetical protein [Planctomycetota bacterium]